MLKPEIVHALDLIEVRAFYPTGSWFTCSPPVTTTDQDWLVLVRDVSEARKVLLSIGWIDCTDGLPTYEGEPGAMETWHAMREPLPGLTNFVLQSDDVLYLRSVGATLIARELNVKDKEKRVELFRAVKFEEPYNGIFPSRGAW